MAARGAVHRAGLDARAAARAALVPAVEDNQVAEDNLVVEVNQVAVPPEAGASGLVAMECVLEAALRLRGEACHETC